jgi:hypothetical protein
MRTRDYAKIFSDWFGHLAIFLKVIKDRICMAAKSEELSPPEQREARQPPHPVNRVADIGTSVSSELENAVPIRFWDVERFQEVGLQDGLAYSKTARACCRRPSQSKVSSLASGIAPRWGAEDVMDQSRPSPLGWAEGARAVGPEGRRLLQVW